MDIKMNVLAKVLRLMPAEQAALIRGAHGIGKSALAAMLGMVFGYEVIDLRLSQMTEGDFLGLPKLYDYVYDEDGRIEKHGRTEFMPPDWFVKAQTQPCILLLDEVNRATPELMQCAFQLIYDRKIQERALHPLTRIVACINATHHYQVNEMDPALLNRFATFDLIPDIKDWLKWARSAEGGVDSSIVEFCSQHPDHWWHNPKKGLEPNKVYPTPRGWDMLNRALIHGNLLEKSPNNIFKQLAVSLVGDEAGLAYADFVTNYDRNITAEQLLNRYATDVRPRVEAGMTVEQITTLIEKLVVVAEKKKWTKKQVANVATFMNELEQLELVYMLWNKVSSIKGSAVANANTLALHKAANPVIIKAMGTSLDIE